MLTVVPVSEVFCCMPLVMAKVWAVADSDNTNTKPSTRIAGRIRAKQRG